MDTVNLTSINLMPCLNFDAQLSKGEIVDRVIKNYVCSISRGENGRIAEKTYEIIDGNLKYLIENSIPRGHPRHEEIDNKLANKSL